MTQTLVPEDCFPKALRKLLDGRDNGPITISVEEVKEAREWKSRLEKDIMKILDGLEQ